MQVYIHILRPGTLLKPDCGVVHSAWTLIKLRLSGETFPCRNMFVCWSGMLEIFTHLSPLSFEPWGKNVIYSLTHLKGGKCYQVTWYVSQFHIGRKGWFNQKWKLCHHLITRVVSNMYSFKQKFVSSDIVKSHWNECIYEKTFKWFSTEKHFLQSRTAGAYQLKNAERNIVKLI